MYTPPGWFHPTGRKTRSPVENTDGRDGWGSAIRIRLSKICRRYSNSSVFPHNFYHV
ncbi:hypothetical protein GCM10008922_18260 [Faecalicatena contorta]